MMPETLLGFLAATNLDKGDIATRLIIAKIIKLTRNSGISIIKGIQIESGLVIS